MKFDYLKPFYFYQEADNSESYRAFYFIWSTSVGSTISTELLRFTGPLCSTKEEAGNAVWRVLARDLEGLSILAPSLEVPKSFKGYVKKGWDETQTHLA